MMFKNGITIIDYEKINLQKKVFDGIKDELNTISNNSNESNESSNFNDFNDSLIKKYDGNMERLYSYILTQKTTFINIESNSSNDTIINKAKNLISTNINRLQNLYTSVKDSVIKILNLTKIFSNLILNFSKIISNTYKLIQMQSTLILNKYKEIIKKEIEKITKMAQEVVTKIISEIKSIALENLPVSKFIPTDNIELIKSQLPTTGINPETFQKTINNLNNEITKVNNQISNEN